MFYNCNFYFRKTIPKAVLEATQQLTIGHTQTLKLPVLTRWFSYWKLVNSVKENEACLKSAIWSTQIWNNVELKKKPGRLNNLKQLLCEDKEFWPKLSLIEELLRPLKAGILQIEGAVVDASKAHKLVSSAFDRTVEIAFKFPRDQAKELNEVIVALFPNY